jgi:hypothetical protein
VKNVVQTLKLMYTRLKRCVMTAKIKTIVLGALAVMNLLQPLKVSIVNSVIVLQKI